MEKPISIQIPKPCNESWEGMTPDKDGRFCHSCSKVVVDFTSMYDYEIVNYFSEAAKGSTCGRFTASQLNTPLYPEPVIVIKPYKYAWLTPFRKIAAMLVTGLALLLSSCNRRPEIKGEVTMPETTGTTARDTALTGAVVPQDTLPAKPAEVIDKGFEMGEVPDPRPEPERPVKMGKICVPPAPEVLQGDVVYPEPEYLGRVMRDTAVVPVQPEKKP